MTSNALLEKVLEMDAEIHQLRQEIVSQDKVITGLQHYLKIAADYRNEDPEKTLAAIQAALGKASSYSKGRKVNRRRK